MRKKQKMTPEIKETKRLRKSFKVKKLEGTLLMKADPPLISFKGIETTLKEKNEEEYKYECCFECKESAVLNSREHTIFVRGFDPSLARDDIKAALKAHFRTCGRVCRVFVPTHCQTGTTLGYAFIDMPGDADKSLKLSGSSLGGWSLEVMMAKDRPGEFCGFPTLKGCKRCYVITQERIHQRFTITNGGRCLPTKFKFPYL